MAVAKAYACGRCSARLGADEGDGGDGGNGGALRLRLRRTTCHRNTRSRGGEKAGERAACGGTLLSGAAASVAGRRERTTCDCPRRLRPSPFTSSATPGDRAGWSCCGGPGPQGLLRGLPAPERPGRAKLPVRRCAGRLCAGRSWTWQPPGQACRASAAASATVLPKVGAAAVPAVARPAARRARPPRADARESSGRASARASQGSR